tara:strand:- start:55 stop:1059 length:1005 start_codon:yes stop_codon:yes gene_type:complete
LSKTHTKHKWLEISLTVDSETAEAASEVLSRFSCKGISMEPIHENYTNKNPYDTSFITENYKNLILRGYIEITPNLSKEIKELDQSIEILNMIALRSDLQPLEIKYEYIDDIDWNSTWKEQYKPIKIGKKLVVIPPWSTTNPVDKTIPIIIDPGQAFGTGIHPSTQLCIQAIENHVKPGHQVLDIGCGSGILSIAALKLQADIAIGIDIDEESIKSSQQNAELNGVNSNFHLIRGSLNCISKKHSFQLVVVNILYKTIIHLLNNKLTNIIAPNGILVLSGILKEQSCTVETLLSNNNLEIISKQCMSEEDNNICDWISLICRHKKHNRKYPKIS